MINIVKKTRVLSFGASAVLCVLLSACGAKAADGGMAIKPARVETQSANIAGTGALITDMAAVALSVKDLDASVLFYQDVLEFGIVRAEKTDAYTEMIMSTGNPKGGKVVLFQSLIDAPRSTARVVFFTPDATKVLNRFKQRGMDIIRDASPIAEGVPITIGIAKDPDGNVLEFIQRG